MSFSKLGSLSHLEELGKRDIVQSIRAVEHHTLLSNSLGQILGCLSLACASRSFWCPTYTPGIPGGKSPAVSVGNDKLVP